MRVSGGSAEVKVPLDTVRKEIGETAVSRELLTYGWGTFGQWVRYACLEKYVEIGGTGNNIWIMLNEVSELHCASQQHPPS
jgi:hypothetical protein